MGPLKLGKRPFPFLLSAIKALKPLPLKAIMFLYLSPQTKFTLLVRLFQKLKWHLPLAEFQALEPLWNPLAEWGEGRAKSNNSTEDSQWFSLNLLTLVLVQKLSLM